MYESEPLSWGSASRAYEVKKMGVGALASWRMSELGTAKSLGVSGATGASVR
jgi:hypothetical protein